MDDEPAFLEEWEKAVAAMTITGAACLDLLQSTFHAFLNEYMNQIGNKQVIPQLKKLEQKSWFGNYRLFFQDYLQIDWASSGADLELLEQVILTRNDFTHNIDFLSLDAFQAPFHAMKYPKSAFANRKGFLQRTPLVVPGETLQRAVGALRILCEYLDRQRYVLLKRWRAERKAERQERRLTFSSAKMNA